MFCVSFAACSSNASNVLFKNPVTEDWLSIVCCIDDVPISYFFRHQIKRGFIRANNLISSLAPIPNLNTEFQETGFGKSMFLTYGIVIYILIFSSLLLFSHALKLFVAKLPLGFLKVFTVFKNNCFAFSYLSLIPVFSCSNSVILLAFSAFWFATFTAFSLSSASNFLIMVSNSCFFSA